MVDEIEVDNWADLPEEDDIYHDFPTQPMIVVPPTPILDKDMDDNESVDPKLPNWRKQSLDQLQSTDAVALHTTKFRRA